MVALFGLAQIAVDGQERRQQIVGASTGPATGVFDAMAGTTRVRKPSSMRNPRALERASGTAGDRVARRGLVAGLVAGEDGDRVSPRPGRRAARRTRSAAPGRSGRPRLPGKGREASGRRPRTPAGTSVGVARSTTNSDAAEIQEVVQRDDADARRIEPHARGRVVTVDVGLAQPNSTGRAAVTVSVALPATSAGCAVLPSGRITHSRSDEACFTWSPAVPVASSSEKTEDRLVALRQRPRSTRVSWPAGASTNTSSEPGLADEPAPGSSPRWPGRLRVRPGTRRRRRCRPRTTSTRKARRRHCIARF